MIEKVISKNIVAVSNRSSSLLGDRSKYIGSSDIGYCGRRVLMSKLFPKPITINEAIVFERGHLTETMVSKALNLANIECTYQYKVVYSDNERFVAHIDFSVNIGNNMHIIEVKSVSDLPKLPYESWIMQLQWQMGILASRANKNITGSILVVNLNSGELKEFGEYSYSKEIFNGLLKRANILIEYLDRQDISINSEESLLCNSCKYRSECISDNVLKKDIPDDVKKKIIQYKRINKHSKRCKTSLGVIRGELIEYFGRNFKGTIGGTSVKISEIKDNFVIGIDTLRKNDREQKIIKKRNSYLKLEIV